MTRTIPYASILGRLSLHRPPAPGHLAMFLVFVFVFYSYDLKDFFGSGAQLPYQSSQVRSALSFKATYCLIEEPNQALWDLSYSPWTHLVHEASGVNCRDVIIFRGRWVGVVLAHQASIKVLYCCELCQPSVSRHKLYNPETQELEHSFRPKQCGTLSLQNWRLHSLHQTWE